MNATLRRWITNLARSGLHDQLSPEMHPRIVLTNVVALIVFAMCVPYIPIHLFTGSPIRAGMLLAEMAVLALVIVLNARGRHLAARWLLLLTMDLFVLAVVATAGPGSLVWVCCIAVAAVSPLPFVPRERVHAALGMSIAVIIAVLGYTGVLSPVGAWLGEPPFPPAGEVLIVLGSMVIAPLLVYWQASAKDRSLVELHTTQVELQAEVERASALAAALERRSDQARDASRAKSQFLAHMSHEIRTPLAAVISLVELARETEQRAVQAEYLQTAGESAGQLLRILNDILDLSKVEQGDMRLEAIPFDVGELITDVVRLTQVRVTKPGVEICAEVVGADELWRVGDPLRLKQVLLNLATNAVKFTETGMVRIGVRATGDTLTFDVTDTGEGMDDAQLQRVFEAFHQADPSTTRIHGGTGLGLTISRHIVHRMGGELAVQSTPGTGSRFWFELDLPATRAPSLLPNMAADDDEPLQLRILVVEDNAVNRMIARRLLESLGHEVHTVDDGQAGVHAAFDGFDAILMDIQMPVMDGLEATRQIRAIEAARGYPRLPIVALTANAMKGDRKLCLDAGMDEHLAKPLDREEATELLGRLTAAARLRRGA